MNTIKDHKIISILQILQEYNKPIGSTVIALKLQETGFDLSERTIRYYLKKMDEKGLTRNFGKRGRDWCRNENHTIADEHIGVVGTTFSFNVSANAGRQLVEGFLNRDYDEVYVIFSEFISMGRQTPVVKQLIPIPPIETGEDTEADESGEYQAEHICEPSPDKLLGELLPQSVHVQLHSALLETSTSEHAARMAAMDNATKACNDFIENLTLLFNKARQAAITAELMDIVGGAEALKG